MCAVSNGNVSCAGNLSCVGNIPHGGMISDGGNFSPRENGLRFWCQLIPVVPGKKAIKRT